MTGQAAPRIRAHGGRLRLGRWLAAGIDLLLPPVCNLCGQPLALPGRQPLLCDPCQQGLQNMRGPACTRCAAPLGPVTAGDRCPRCRDQRLTFRGALALGVYRDTLRDAVIRMKQRIHEPLTLSVGHLMAIALTSRIEPLGCDLIAPVPNHWTKRWLRGVNGPDLLADAMAARLELDVRRNLLRRRRITRKQGTLMPSERRKNVSGAFALTTGYDIRGGHVLLVDDIMTTGATANEAARSLLRGGASAVTVAVAARGVGIAQRGS
jgi:ComF family protein